MKSCRLSTELPTATLIQTGKISRFPLIFVGVDYWQPLFDFLQSTLLKHGAIGQEDFDRLLLTDSIDEIRQAVECCRMLSVDPERRSGKTEDTRMATVTLKSNGVSG